MDRLRDRIVLVTGAGQGIGAAYARAMAAEGARLAVNDVIDPGATVDAVRAAGGEAIGIEADVTDAAAVAAMVEETVSAFGGIDVLVNNAAIFAPLESRPFTEIPSDEWDRVMAVNARGTFECARAVVPAMRARGRGKIVNIASGTVFKGSTGICHYVASKGAVVAMTRVMARELGDDNICVNALAPGMTLSEGIAGQDRYVNSPTPATRCFKRHQYPDDLTGAVVFLASADSDFMTGQCMVVDGGAVMP